VFVVGCLGDWRAAAEVLFESESLSGNIKPSRAQRESVAGYVESSFGQYREDVISGTIKASGGVAAGGSETFITHCVETFPTLLSSTAGVSRPGNETTEHQTYVAYGFTQCDAARDAGNNISPTLRSGGNGGYPSHSVAYGFEPGIAKREGNPNRFSEELSPTLRANMGDNQVAAAFCDTYNGTIQGDVSATMTADMAGPTHSGPKVMQNVPISWDAELNANENKMGTLVRGGQGGRNDGVMMTNMAVRRLTPVECERLQGFPDDYTNIKDKCPDGPRYKAMGNSMAVPVMRWIGERINKVNSLL
jgi:DNA (cytosine-5)-methyltransferase 1